MGIYSRDYVREPSGRRHGGWGEDNPACKWLIIVTVVVYLLQFVTAHPVEFQGEVIPDITSSYINDWFALTPDVVRSGQVWRLLTYAFLHDQHNLLHIVFNMLGLWWFGAEMGRLYGSREFTLFYLAGAIAAGCGFVIWQLAMHLAGGVVGASGAVLAVLTLYATHYPRQRIYIYGIIPLEIRWVLALYIAFDMWPVLQALQGSLPRSNIAHAAHLIGILFGWLYRHFDWRLSGWLDGIAVGSLTRRWRQSQVKKNLRVFDPEPPADLESELDRILAKIHQEGSESLTEREQSILTRASQQYKNRQ